MAEEWADTNEYPFKSRDEISRVAQYLQISGLDDNPGFLYIETLTDSFRRGLPPEFRKGKENQETFHTSDSPPYGSFVGCDVWECDFSAFDKPGSFVGRAPQQVDEFLSEVIDPIRTRYNNPLPPTELRV